jgi:hypothetical protein
MRLSTRLSAIVLSTFVAALLTACGMFKPQQVPTLIVSPADQATVLVKIDNVDALPTTSFRSKLLYRDWLTKSPPRAFVLAADGSAYRTWGVTTDPTVPQDVPERALHRCIKAGKQGCKLYAVDNSVVWNN